MALTFTNTTNTTYSAALVPADSPIVKQSGAGHVLFSGTNATFYGLIQHDIAADGFLIWYPQSAGQNFFSTTQTTTYTVASGRLALFKGRTIGGAQIGSFTLNANFSGLGGVFAQNDEGAAASVVTINGTVAGLTGVNPNAVTVGLKVYVAGTMNIRDLPSQLSYESIGVTTCSFVVNNTTAATTYPTICVINTLDGGSATHVLKSNGFAISFGDATNGSLRRTSGSGVGTLTFVLGGISAASELNTMLYGTTATTGPVALRKDDGNTWVLAGNNSALSSTALVGGTLRATNSNAIGGALTMSASTVFEVAGGISASNAINGIGTIRNVSGSNTLSGALVLAGATTFESQAGTLTLNSGTSISGTQNIAFSGAGNHTVTSVIATSTGTVTKNGAGTTTLNGANSFSGLVTINAGVVEANTITASGNNSLGTNSALSMTSSTLRYTGSTPANLAKSVTATGATGLAFENTGTSGFLVGSSVVMPTSNTVLGLGGTNTGYNLFTAAPANLIGVTKSGASRWILTGGKDMTGTTDVNAGTLMASNVNSNLKLLGATVNVAAGAKIQTGSDTAQGGKCTYTSLAFNGAVGNKARIRIGGGASNPTIYMNGDLTLPASGTTSFDLSAALFRTPGTYTLIEFAAGKGVVGGSIAGKIVATGLAAGQTASFAYTGTGGAITVTIS